MLPIVLVFLVSAQLLGPAPPGGTKVAVVNLREAITRTHEGRARVAELQAGSSERQESIREKQVELEALRSRLAASANILSGPAYEDLTREIQDKATQLQREIEDAQWEFANEQRRILEQIGPPLLKLTAEYAREHGYDLVLDLSSPDAIAAWAAESVDITDEIARRYNESQSSPPPSSGQGSSP